MSVSVVTIEASNPAYRARVNYTEQKARRYQTRRGAKHRAELRLVERAFQMIPRGRILDVPCGGGRISLLLARKGYEVTGADLSEPMLAIARENIQKAGLTIAVEHQDIERLRYADGSFDSVICFRLFHHLPTAEIRRRVVRELCRVTNRFVALSFFSPYSVTSTRRRWRAALGLGKLRHHQTPLHEVGGYFESAGFHLVKDFAQFPFWHTLHLTVFERDAATQ
jgi:SAM-dependent methyltransferase